MFTFKCRGSNVQSVFYQGLELGHIQRVKRHGAKMWHAVIPGRPVMYHSRETACIDLGLAWIEKMKCYCKVAEMDADAGDRTYICEPCTLSVYISGLVSEEITKEVSGVGV